MSEFADEQREILASARRLRRQGHVDAAREALTAGWQQAEQEQRPHGWLALELADICFDQADLAQSAHWAAQADRSHQHHADPAGCAAAALVLGDVAWAIGQPVQARSHWANARSIADAAGAGPLASRALLALAIAQVGGDAAVADAQLDAAEARASVVPVTDDPDALEVWKMQADAVRASLAIHRANQAVAARRWPEARLLLGAAAQSAGQLADPSLYANCLRVDAALARKACDPDAAVVSLRLAVRAATAAGATPLAWQCRCELALALIDNEAWAQAAELIPAELPQELTQLPVIAAAVLESFAAIALASGDPSAAEPALYRAIEERRRAADVGGELRALAALADALRLSGARTEALAVERRLQALAASTGQLGHQLVVCQVACRLAGEGVSVELANRAVQLAAAAGGIVDQLVALDGAADSRLRHGDAQAALAIANQAVALAHEQPLVRLQARSQARRCQALFAVGDFAHGQSAAQLAAELAETANDWQTRARVLLVVGGRFAAEGRADEAVLAFSRAQQAADSAKRTDLQGESWLALGQVWAGLRTFEDAGVAFARAAQVAQACGAIGLSVRALRGQAWCAREQGQSARAWALLTEARQTAQAADLPAIACAVAVDEAQLWINAGDLAAAAQHLTALDLHLAPAAVRGEALALLGQIHAKQGDFARADDILIRALVDLRRAGEPRSLGAALYVAGQVAGARGDGARAGQALAEALALAVRGGLPEVALIRATIDRIGRQAREQHL